MTDNQPQNGMLMQALRYAKRGWAVFPLKPRDKVPLTAHGCKDASTDEARIRAWWAAHPDANIGIATGCASGIFVVDVDGGLEGERSLHSLVGRYGPLPSTGEVITGSGKHLYFNLPEGRSIPNSVSKIAEKVDIRGEGGYVVAPPSVHPTGTVYTKSVDSAESVADAPGWLLALLDKPPANTTKTAVDWKALLEGTKQGQRNDSLARLAGLLFSAGLNPFMVAELCLCWNEARCAPPLPDDEALRTVNSIACREYNKKGKPHD